MSNARILVVMDRTFDPALDSGVAIIEEALRGGMLVDVCDAGDLCFAAGGVAAEVRRVHAADVTGMALQAPVHEPLTRYQAILLRKDPPFTVETLHATQLLEHARGHALLVNDPRGLRDVNEKLFALRFPAFTPATEVHRDPALIRAFCEEHGGICVLKPLDGCGGRGVFVLRESDCNGGAIVEAATDEGRRPIIAQAWLPVTEHGDKRIFVLDGEPVGALLRMPADTDSRANLCRGGTALATTLTSRELEIARVVGRACRELGLSFVGLDTIAGRLTEVNVTSPTGFRQLEQVSGVRLQERVVAWLAARLPAGLTLAA